MACEQEGLPFQRDSAYDRGGMLTLCDPKAPMARSVLASAGGFAWWYLDLLDANGSGVVVIWSYGLPFLPGYASAARRGAPQQPKDRPSFNIVAYDRGVATFYLLQEHAPEEVVWIPESDTWVFGRTTIRGVLEGEEYALRVELDCAVPASAERLVGSVVARGIPRQAGPESRVPGVVPHLWTPVLGPARGSASMWVGDRRVIELEGRAYHDRNSSPTPLHALGIEHWVWGRLPFEDREVIFYLTWPKSRSATPLMLGFTIHADGRTERLDGLTVTRRGLRLGKFGMPHWAHLEIAHHGRRWLTVREERVVDDGPFYLRTFLHAVDADGREARGFGELCRPDRIDLDLQRPFVRMRVHQTRGENSPFLPLFAGLRADRVVRLASQLGTRLGALPAPKESP